MVEKVSRLRAPWLGLLSLLGGQLLLIYLVHIQLGEVLASKPEYLYFRILPGLVWPLAFSWLGAAWLARRRPGSTALPLGYGLATSLWLILGVLRPVFRQGLAQGMSAEQASALAWSAGVAVTVLAGLSQLCLAPIAGRWLKNGSGNLSSVLSAALALAALVVYLPTLREHPLMFLAGVITLVAFLQLGLPRPFGLTVGWLALGSGWVVQAVSGTFMGLPEWPGSLLPNWQIDWILQGFSFLWLQPEFLSAVIPLLLVSLARDLTLLAETQSGPLAPSPQAALAGIGLLNLGGALLGCGLPLGLLPGYSGFQRWSCGQVYAQGAGLLLLGFALLGGFGDAMGWLPLPTLGVLWVGLLLTSASQSLNRLTVGSGAVMAAGWLPFFLVSADGAPVAILCGLVWGGIASAVTLGNFGSAAWAALAGCLLTTVGVLHRGTWRPDFDGEALIYLVLAILLHIGWVMGTSGLKEAARAPRPPVDPKEPSDSSESPGMSAFGIPGDNRSVEGAGSGTPG